ncbi:MAG: SDR family NAD(P)-dependent oxidoreductase [Acidimicrobiales bacterium]
MPGIHPVDLHGRTIVITGGNAGIGREAAVSLARMGANVVITARDPIRGGQAREYVRSRSGSDAVELGSLDLASFASIRAFAEWFLEGHDRLDVLVNNAGGILSNRLLTSEGLEMTFGVNHVGHALLTSLLLDRLTADAPSRIVNLASIAHRFGSMHWADLQYERSYVGTVAYNQSKLANVLFTAELARRLAGTGVTAMCCHPGPVRSGFGADRDTRGVERFFLGIARPFEISPRWGSRVITYLASQPLPDDAAGGYFVGGYLGRSARHRPSKEARDPAAARRLWDVTEQLITSASP